MTAEDAVEGQPSAAQCAVALDGLHGIFGAGRQVAAGWRKQGRDGPLVDPQQLQRVEFGDVAHGENPKRRMGASEEPSVVPTGLVPISPLCPALPRRAFTCRPFRGLNATIPLLFFTRNSFLSRLLIP